MESIYLEINDNMKKSEIIKKYTELYGKRPTLQIDKNMSESEKLQIKQLTKLNQFKWTLRKQIFVESVEKSTDVLDKISFAKDITDKFTETDLLKIFHGYRYTLDLNNKSYSLSIADD